MTQYAKQGTTLYYGESDEILSGKYECISCEYGLEAVFKNDGDFSHFKHPSNSRNAHFKKYKKHCPQMSTKFDSTTQGLQNAKNYTTTTMKHLLEQAETGVLDPRQVVGHLRMLESLIGERASFLVDLKVFEERTKGLDYREAEIEKKEAEIEKQEEELNKRFLNKAIRSEGAKKILKDFINKIPPWQVETVLNQKIEDSVRSISLGDNENEYL